jgi:hypothetical protein
MSPPRHPACTLTIARQSLPRTSRRSTGRLGDLDARREEQDARSQFAAAVPAGRPRPFIAQPRTPGEACSCTGITNCADMAMAALPAGWREVSAARFWRRTPLKRLARFELPGQGWPSDRMEVPSARRSCRSRPGQTFHATPDTPVRKECPPGHARLLVIRERQLEQKNEFEHSRYLYPLTKGEDSDIPGVCGGVTGGVDVSLCWREPAN